MTISPYQVENVLRAYAKQSNSRRSAFGAAEPKHIHRDIVSLSGQTKEGAYDKISYSLLDIILHVKK
ncbi:MAG: hypothetical protein M0P57_02510 [Syntrophales bacterium]|nr:hypothetical protein [Syntrophales bacterium]MDY0044275.1 hypothetical protein [Syntrophales bacterium]